jgi:hypothetical protein
MTRRSSSLVLGTVLFGILAAPACSSGGGNRDNNGGAMGGRGEGGAPEKTGGGGGNAEGGNRNTNSATGGKSTGGTGSGGNATGGTSSGGTGGAGKTGGTGGTVQTGGSGGTRATGGAGGTIPPVGGAENFLIAENFEGGIIDLGKWTAPEEGDGAKILVQTDQAAHGRHALRIDIPGTMGTGGGNRTATIRIKQTPAALTGHVFARMYVRFSPSPNYKDILYSSDGGYTHFGTFPNNGARWMAQIGGSEDIGGNVIPGDKWLCLEAEWETGPFRLTLYVDGVSAYNRTGTSAAGFQNITLGLKTGHAPEADAKVWIDDFAMDTKRIGCL